jgi:hypothetical protein
MEYPSTARRDDKRTAETSIMVVGSEKTTVQVLAG